MPRTIFEIDRNLRLLSQLLEITTITKERNKIKKKIDDMLDERNKVESDSFDLKELIESYSR